VVRLTSPNGGEILRPGSTWNIGWSFETLRPAAKTKLLYSTNGGTTWNLIKTFKGDPSATNANYGCIVPNISSKNVR
jgi:hypothetical protein